MKAEDDVFHSRRIEATSEGLTCRQRQLFSRVIVTVWVVVEKACSTNLGTRWVSWLGHRATTRGRSRLYKVSLSRIVRKGVCVLVIPGRGRVIVIGRSAVHEFRAIDRQCAEEDGQRSRVSSKRTTSQLGALLYCLLHNISVNSGPTVG